MPYYQWTGIDISGQVKKGKLLASSSELLEKKLLEQNIALMAAKPVRNWSWYGLSRFDQLDFFKQLCALLSAGIFSTDALDILIKQSEPGHVVSMLEQIHQDVCAGISLSSALEKHKTYFDSLTIALLRAGEESGNVVHALEVLCGHIEFKQQFYRKLKAAALMPAITLLFFLGISLFIVSIILPKFAILFAEHNQPLPWMTQILLSYSAKIHRFNGIVIVGLVGILWGIKQVKERWSRFPHLILSLPFLSTVIVDVSITYFLKSLTVLLQGGVPLVQALAIAQHSVSNTVIKSYVVSVTHEVDKGHDLSEALKESAPVFFSVDFVTMIKVGEESGQLTSMIGHCAAMYEKRVEKSLDFFSALFQPSLMIILGLMIAFLIMAVYVPVFELSQGINWS